MFTKGDYKISKIKEHLTEEELAKMEELKESAPSLVDFKLTKELKVWLSDACMFRYLRARSWNLGKAKELLANSLKWRKEFKPLSITPEEIMWYDYLSSLFF